MVNAGNMLFVDERGINGYVRATLVWYQLFFKILLVE